jgi:hypothetical protein
VSERRKISLLTPKITEYWDVLKQRSQLNDEDYEKREQLFERLDFLYEGMTEEETEIIEAGFYDRADEAMAEREKTEPHLYSPDDTCGPCSVWMKVVRRSDFEDGFICRQDPDGIHWKAMQLHVRRAKFREHWVIEGVTSNGPAELVYTYAGSQIEWVYALMYMLGWKRPEWAKDWEWM